MKKKKIKNDKKQSNSKHKIPQASAKSQARSINTMVGKNNIELLNTIDKLFFE